MDKLKKEFASKLLKVKAIKLQPNDPFTWASAGSHHSIAITARLSHSRTPQLCKA